MSPVEIPLSAPDITDAEIEAVVSVLRTSRLSLGPKMAEFEAAMAAYVGAPTPSPSAPELQACISRCWPWALARATRSSSRRSPSSRSPTLSGTLARSLSSRTSALKL